MGGGGGGRGSVRGREWGRGGGGVRGGRGGGEKGRGSGKEIWKGGMFGEGGECWTRVYEGAEGWKGEGGVNENTTG